MNELGVIKTANAAFYGHVDDEVARILEDAARRVRSGALDNNRKLNLFDINGGKVGSIYICEPGE